MMRKEAFGTIAVLLTLTSCLRAQQIFDFDMNTASAWTVVQDIDAEAEFGFDYSPLGIPAAPNGQDTRGIYLAANLVEPGEAAAISVSPKDFVASGQYRVAVDFWINFYADLDKVGTTEFARLFVGFDPAAGPVNGAGFLGDSDGDTSRDYRLYKDDVEVPLESGSYEIESQNNTDFDLVDKFPGQETPAAQTDLDFFDPPNEDTLTDDGTLAFAWHTLVADVDSDAGTATFIVDGLTIGTVDAMVDDPVQLVGGVALTVWDVFSSVAPVPDFAFTVFDNLVVDVVSATTPGDFDNDGNLDIDDINALSQAIKGGNNNGIFDLDGDGDVNTADQRVWVKDLKNTWFGDANLDGEFNSSDFVSVFQKGEYEDGLVMNSTWDEGDWNADGDFDSTDFVRAFQDGGFELGPRQATSSVPEPASFGVFFCGCMLVLLTRNQSGSAVPK